MRLIVAGDGVLREQVVRLLDQANASHLAWLPGERTDIPELLRGLDCFVLPSLAEGISNTILEAMASGLPVVATRVGGNAELLEDGVTGRLVPAGDSPSLSQAILDYFSDPGIAVRHGKAARLRAERIFGLERMIAAYTRLYQTALGNQPAPETPLPMPQTKPPRTNSRYAKGQHRG
jgi:glycosyltransferase involved in cell wall biosynthesis